MLIIAALGDNALLGRGQKPDAVIQHRHIRRAARALAPLAAKHELVVCHGNGAQAGLPAREDETDYELSTRYPLDVLGAQTQGMIGYWLAQELRNAGVSYPIVSIVTQTVVDAADPSFDAPTAFVGPGYDRHRALRLAGRYGWTVAADGNAWRRVVASPQPEGVVEMTSIRALVDEEVVVVCGGGGGAPVVESESGELIGVDAVLDEDLTAALLGRELRADLLLLLTDVGAVMRDFGTEHATPIRETDVATLEGMAFPAGSMRSEMEACTRFVRATGRRAAIGALADANEIVAGRAGTTISFA